MKRKSFNKICRPLRLQGCRRKLIKIIYFLPLFTLFYGNQSNTGLYWYILVYTGTVYSDINCYKRLLPLRPEALHHLRHAVTSSVSHAMAHLGDPVTPPTTPLQCRPHQIWMLASAPPHFFFIRQQSRLLHPRVAAPRRPQGQRAAVPDRKRPRDIFLLSAAVAPPINI